MAFFSILFHLIKSILPFKSKDGGIVSEWFKFT